MGRIVAGGTGFIGRALVNHWLIAGHNVAVISRDPSKVKRLFGERVTAWHWSELTTQLLPTLKNYQLIVNLAGASIAGQRWTEQRKQAIKASRIEATQKLAELCAQLGEQSPALFNANGVGIYGHQSPVKVGLPPALDENTQIDFSSAPDFLAEVGREWEKALSAAERARVRVVKMRFGVVLSKLGGALPQMAFPFKFGLGGLIGSGQQPISWITRVELMAIIEFLIARPEISGPINVVAPECVTQAYFAKTLGKVLKKPAFVRMPAVVLRMMLGQMADELLLNGQHVQPGRLQQLGYAFHHPTLLIALQSIYAGDI